MLSNCFFFISIQLIKLDDDKEKLDNDWYIAARNKSLLKNESTGDRRQLLDDNNAKIKTKSFLGNEISELNAMSKLSLLDGDDEKLKMDDK